MKNVVVVGGGIAGLATANKLQALARAADTPLKLTLIEREPRLGGKILTERVDAPESDFAAGFVIKI